MHPRHLRSDAGPWRLLLAGLGMSVLGACAGEPEAATGWTASVDTVDGRVRVVNVPPPGGAAPDRAAREEFRIGTMEESGPTSFGLIRSLAVLDDGRFAVGDGMAEEVRLFDRQGRHLRTFGGKGAGPGELDGMQGAFVDHEGMLRVAEQGNARLSIFHPDSGFVGSIPVRLYSYGFRGPWEAAIDPSGRTVVASSGQFGEGRFWNMLRVYDPEMTQLDSVPYDEYTGFSERGDEYPGTWRITLGNGEMHVQVPFFAQPRQIVTPTAELWTSAEGAERLEIVRWRPPADTTLVIVSERPVESVTSSERDSAMADVRERLAERVPGSTALDPSRIPDTKPPVYGLSLDDRGRLWARITDPAADTTVFDVFSEDGVHAESIAFPFRVDGWVPPVVRGDTVWAVVIDDVDVQYVARARLPTDRPDGD